jgi:hypothetical protein
MSRPPLVFVTYSRLVPPTQIGVLKRCLRLASRLDERFDVHVVNFGPLPEADPLLAEMAPRLTLHAPPLEGLGDWLEALFRRLELPPVVLGESPIRGSMRLAHRVAHALGLFQVCIDNYYGPFFATSLPRGWPRIDHWLLLGLTEHGEPHRWDEGCEVLPPLVRLPAGDRGPRDRVAVLGYDKETLALGLALLARLPPELPVDLFVGAGGEGGVNGRARARPGLAVHPLPTDAELYGALGRARLVVGKAGFQQVAEAVLLGAPILCRACGGGIDEFLLAEYLRPYVRIVGSAEELPKVLFDVACWLLAPPANRWAESVAAVGDPVAFAADVLAERVAASAR